MRKIRSWIAGGMALTAVTAGVLFIMSHGTWLGYNDWMVVGKTCEQVEERYGDFDREYDHKKGYYVGTDQSLFLDNGMPLYYWMICDDSGVITDVYVDSLPGG